jgi:hypothetical protein
MKKILLILSIAPLLVTLTSCEKDPLRLLPPDGQVKDEYWKTKEEVKATLMGVYQKFTQKDVLLFFLGELRGDMLEADVNLSDALRNIMNSNIYPENEWTDWIDFYAAINYCNLVLKYSPQVKQADGTFTDYQYNAYNAEAIFLRSLAYFYLVRSYKDVPFILTPYDSDDQDFFHPKTEDKVILDSLENQLTRILHVIPEDYETNAKTRGRATRGAVNALLADIALWKYEYEDCIMYVERIEESDLYDLVPGGIWFTIFSEGNTLEGIFELQYDSRLGQHNHVYPLTSPVNRNVLASTFALDLLSPEISGEVIRGYGSLRTQDKLIWKYLGQSPDEISFRSGINQRSCNWIFYRLADVLLMKAEALSQLGRFDEALAIVNRIRERAYMEPASAKYSPQAFEDLILEERAKELAFEGKRWFDLLRMGRRNNYERKGKLIEQIIQNVPATQKRVLASKLNDPYGWYLPIYKEEAENNPNLVQNPYYQVYE